MLHSFVGYSCLMAIFVSLSREISNSKGAYSEGNFAMRVIGALSLIYFSLKRTIFDSLLIFK